MLNGIHFLLTYQCNFECDHCFLYCSPFSDGVFSLADIKKALNQAKELKSIEWIYFEGGEPFLYYPLLANALILAKKAGFNTGIVTNAYWATTEEDARLWLEPIKTSGIDDLSISRDSFHNEDSENNCANRAYKAAKKLKILSSQICIEAPKIIDDDRKRGGQPVMGGDVLFKGRAVDKLIKGLPLRNYAIFNGCPHEELKSPERVHIDSFGNVHLCQGLVIGNIFKKPLKKIFTEYDPETHPIIGPILKGGPAELARKFNFDISPGFVDACHLCFVIRRALLDKFPDYLAPRQVYGIGL